MKTLLFAILFLGAKFALACSCASSSFCTTAYYKSNDLILSGLIVDTASHSIKIKIIETLRGIENRDTITVWDGTDFDCNGLFSMKAGMIGKLGDSILIILPKIESLQNSWDVIGDYRRPEYFCVTTQLDIRNDSLIGLIAPSSYQYPYGGQDKIKYSDFTSFWSGNNDDCRSLVTNINNFSIEESIEFIQSETTLEINSSQEMTFDFELISITGIIIQNSIFNKYVKLDISTLSSGLYIIRVRNDKGDALSRKIVIK
jgi:hypothetical protein